MLILLMIGIPPLKEKQLNRLPLTGQEQSSSKMTKMLKKLIEKEPMLIQKLAYKVNSSICMINWFTVIGHESNRVGVFIKWDELG